MEKKKWAEILLQNYSTGCRCNQEKLTNDVRLIVMTNLSLPKHSFCTEWDGKSNRVLYMISNYMSWLWTPSRVLPYVCLFFQNLEGQRAGRSSSGCWEAFSQGALFYLSDICLPAVWSASWKAQRHREELVLPAASSACCSSRSWFCWVLEREISNPKRAAAELSLFLLTSLHGNSLGTEKIQERDPFISFPCFTFSSTFLTPLPHSHLCATPPPPQLFWEQRESTYI